MGLDFSLLNFTQIELLSWFSQYAYQPWIVYTAVILFMFASSFGLPIPEEIVLISVGLVCYLALHPDKFPPPYDGESVVDPVVAATVCFLAVFLSDYIVYWIGRRYGRKLFYVWPFRKFNTPEIQQKIESWVKNYGFIAPGVFRFTPGLRFPGHMTCGIIGIPPWKFIAVNGFAALISVPTQVLFLAYYGEVILEQLQKFKLYVLVILATGIIIYVIYRYLSKRNLNRTF